MSSLTVPQAFDLAMQCHRAGRLADAERLYRQLLAVQPQHVDALHLLGVVLFQCGRADAAVDWIGKAIALQPEAADFHSNLALALKELGRLDEAEAACRRALELQPDLAGACNNLGTVWELQGRIDEAAAAYRQAIALQPANAEARNNLGNALRKQKRPEEAVAAYREALRLDPSYAHAHTNLGVVLDEQGRIEEAIAEHRAAVGLRPGLLDAHYNLANALRKQAHLDAAIAEYQRALEMHRDFGPAWNNLGTALKDAGRVVEGLAAYREALRCAPGDAFAHSNLLLSLHYVPGVDRAAILAEHRRWDDVHAAPLADPIAPHAGSVGAERRLKIGYVSPDFRDHSVACFFESLLASHDRAEVEVFCYDLAHSTDAVAERLRKLSDHWRWIRDVNDAAAAEQIRADRIDVLVDLAGHTANSRLLIFVRRPAPVQVSWLGYCDTTGMRAMDYRLSDAHADPPGTSEPFYVEELVRLPDCAWCFRPHAEAPPVAALPSASAGFVTFGCFNALPKITDAQLRLWARIVNAVPGSRLLLKCAPFVEASAQARMRTALQTAGLGPERVDLLSAAPKVASHLATYARVDIALDTFPYHGTTTTCEALWMGVPVVTLAGSTHASRVGVSLLHSAGLPELIANEPDEYVGIAVRLGRDGVRLAELRRTLRERMARSPMMDAPRFARSIEAAYRRMWSRWCAARA